MTGTHQAKPASWAEGVVPLDLKPSSFKVYPSHKSRAQSRWEKQWTTALECRRGAAPGDGARPHSLPAHLCTGGFPLSCVTLSLSLFPSWMAPSGFSSSHSSVCLCLGLGPRLQAPQRQDLLQPSVRYPVPGAGATDAH